MDMKNNMARFAFAHEARIMAAGGGRRAIPGEAEDESRKSPHLIKDLTSDNSRPNRSMKCAELLYFSVSAE